MKQLLMWTLLAVLTAGQGADRAEVQFQAAIKKEVFDGDLKGAIVQYKQLANGSNRAVAAKALVRMGECYEKLGDAEARKAYERVVRDFADQKDALAEAQKHLAANSAQSETGILVQQVAVYPDKRVYSQEGGLFAGQSISRDGRYLVFKKEGEIFLQDLLAGTERRIVPKSSQQETLDAAIFPDGRQIVYSRMVGSGYKDVHSELYVSSADGSNPRLVFGGKVGELLVLSTVSPDGRQLAYFLCKPEGDGIRADLYVIDHDGTNPRPMASVKTEMFLSILWSPDGKRLLVWAARNEPVLNGRLLLVSVADGSSRIMGSGTGFGQFSPDGRYISFYRWPVLDSGFQGGIYIAPADGGKEVLLVGGAASDPRWTPDGKRIIFRDQRPDQSLPRRFMYYLQEPWDIYSIRVMDGKPGGNPELMKKDVVLPARLLGPTEDGNYFYSTTLEGPVNVYLVDMDPATGKLVSKPARLNQTFVNFSGGPLCWSPDGKWLAYNKVGAGSPSPRALMIRSADKGEEHPLTVSPPFDSNQYCNPLQWFPDSRSLLVVDQSKKGHFVLRKVDVQTGQQQLFFERPGSDAMQFSAALSPDGKSLFFSLSKPGISQSGDSKTTAPGTLMLMRRNMENGEEKELFQAQSPSSSTGFVIALSSDGRQLAFTRLNNDKTTSLFTMPADGGDARELYRSNLLLEARSWTKDGRHILVVQSDPSSGMNQFWSVSAENAERGPAGLTFPVIGMASLHPDGRRFTFVGRQPGQTELWVMKLLPPGTKPSR
jgi:Tol biopolymer transport system component